MMISSVILCDTGPIVALIDEDDPNHESCLTALSKLPKRPMVTTWGCLTEAMYLAQVIGGHPAQERLWSYIASGKFVLHVHGNSEQNRMRELMIQYKDVPMDFADASLVAVAESLNIDHIFTFDSDFYAYRLFKNRAFVLIPWML